MSRISIMLILLLAAAACTEGEVVDRRSFNSTEGGAVDENLTPKNTTGDVPGGDVPIPTDEPADEDEEPTTGDKGADTPTEGKAVGEITNETASEIEFKAVSSYAEYIANSTYALVVTESKVSDITEYKCVECDGDNDPDCINCNLEANKDNEHCFCLNPANAEDDKCPLGPLTGNLTVSFAKVIGENENSITDDKAFPTASNIEIPENPEETPPGLTRIALMKGGVTYTPIAGSKIDFTKLPTADDTSYEVKLDLRLQEDTDPSPAEALEIGYKATIKGDIQNILSLPEECNEVGKNGKKAVPVYAE